MFGILDLCGINGGRKKYTNTYFPDQVSYTSYSKALEAATKMIRDGRCKSVIIFEEIATLEAKPPDVTIREQQLFRGAE